MRVGEAIRLLRVCHDLKQNQLARMLDLSTSHVSDMERERKSPTLEVLGKVAGAFDVPLSSLLHLAEFLSLPPGSPIPQFPNEKAVRLVEMSRLRHSLPR